MVDTPLAFLTVAHFRNGLPKTNTRRWMSLSASITLAISTKTLSPISLLYARTDGCSCLISGEADLSRPKLTLRRYTLKTVNWRTCCHCSWPSLIAIWRNICCFFYISNSIQIATRSNEFGTRGIRSQSLHRVWIKCNSYYIRYTEKFDSVDNLFDLIVLDLGSKNLVLGNCLQFVELGTNILDHECQSVNIDLIIWAVDVPTQMSCSSMRSSGLGQTSKALKREWHRPYIDLHHMRVSDHSRRSIDPRQSLKSCASRQPRPASILRRATSVQTVPIEIRESVKIFYEKNSRYLTHLLSVGTFCSKSSIEHPDVHDSNSKPRLEIFRQWHGWLIRWDDEKSDSIGRFWSDRQLLKRYRLTTDKSSIFFKLCWTDFISLSCVVDPFYFPLEVLDGICPFWGSLVKVDFLYEY